MLSVVGVYQPVLDQLADLDREVARGHKFVLVPVGWKTAIPLPRISSGLRRNVALIGRSLLYQVWPGGKPPVLMGSPWSFTCIFGISWVII